MSDTADFGNERSVLTPTALTRLVRDLLEDALPLIWLEGELSNFSRPASGHLYFSLKDSSAQVRCAMFRPKSTWLRFKPADGMHVLARARVSLYEARGEFQLIVEHMEEAGEGALQREFARLKAQLAAEGLFDSARKRALPRLPRRVAIITSPSGAAVRDVLSVLRRRFPLALVDILPVPVQGKEAAPAIVVALQAVSRGACHDVVLLTRGGGSLEDLWAFNDEAVARAIATITIPVVSAIGHEVDFTIADFIADLRAPTPSAAAELLVPDSLELMRQLHRGRERLWSLWQRTHERAQQRVDRLLARLNAQRPQARLEVGRMRLDALRQRLTLHGHRRFERERAHLRTFGAKLQAHHPGGRLRAQERDLAAQMRRLSESLARSLTQRARHVGELARALNAVNPLATVGRGYAIVYEPATHQVVRSVVQASTDDRLLVQLVDGELDVRVQGVVPKTG